MEELGYPNGVCSFRNAIPGGAKKPLWGPTGATGPGLGVEILEEMQKQLKIPAGGAGGSADPSPPIADCLGWDGKEAMPGGIPAGFLGICWTKTPLETLLGPGGAAGTRGPS